MLCSKIVRKTVDGLMGSQQGLNARNVPGKTSGSLTNGNGNEYGKKR